VLEVERRRVNKVRLSRAEVQVGDAPRG
jgi:hypothetical protein